MIRAIKVSYVNELNSVTHLRMGAGCLWSQLRDYRRWELSVLPPDLLGGEGAGG